MKKQILAILSVLLTVLAVFHVSAITSNAIQLPEAYTVRWTATYTNDNANTDTAYCFTISNANVMFFVFHEHNSGYSLGEYIKSEEKAYNMGMSGDHTGTPVSGFYIVSDKKTGNESVHLEYPMDINDKYYNTILSRFYNVTPSNEYISFNCNCAIFNSLESAEAYFKNGDTSGVISAPPGYDYDHDFRDDTYDANIPMPKLSDITHHSFHVDNADPTRDIEIYIESTFYGVKHTTDTKSGNYFTCDNSFVFNTHRYNLINTDISYSDADIDIKEKFNVDTLGELVKDFKMWSVRYPNHNYLPDCADFNHHPDEDYNTEYKFYHTYNGGLASKDDNTRIRESKQASTTYYVRFCEYAAGKGYRYGKWAAYTYTPQGYGQRDDVTQGGVTPDPETGKPVITDPETGKQDPDTGIIEPGNPGPELVWPDFSAGSMKEMIDEVIGTLSSLSSFFGEFPAFLSATFVFIPSYIWSIIGAGLVFIIIVAALKALLSLK